MSSNRRGLRRNIRAPKRYGNSEINAGKRAGKGAAESNNDGDKEIKGNKVDPIELSQESVVSGNCVESEEGQSSETGKNDEIAVNNDVGVNSNANRSVETNNEGIDTNVQSNVENVDNSKENMAYVDNRKNYASVVMRNEVKIDNHLIYIAPKISEDGTETVLFDDDIVQKGCVKWQTTLCGYFVGQNMGFNELRYHIRRMWGKFGFKEVIVNDSGINLFKFKDLEGMENVLNKGPWMVNNRPLFVLKWNPEIGMKKIEPTKLPVWVKLMNVPMEAWSMEGISALTSSLGKPLMMDEMTARMCQNGVGRSDYARVLVEFEAVKELKNEIKIVYTDKEENVKGSKMVNVLYDWKPDSCSHCKVFGHSLEKCNTRPRTAEELKAKAEEVRLNKLNETKNVKENDERQEKNGNWQQQRRNGQYKRNNYRQEYREKNVNVETVNKGKNTVEQNKGKGPAITTGDKSNGKGTNVQASSSNQFAVLNEVMDMEKNEVRILKGRMVVDSFLNKKLQPNCIESSNWTPDMIRYFKDQWELDRLKEKEVASKSPEDVLENGNEIAQAMTADNVNGMSKTVLN